MKKFEKNLSIYREHVIASLKNKKNRKDSTQIYGEMEHTKQLFFQVLSMVIGFVLLRVKASNSCHKLLTPVLTCQG